MAGSFALFDASFTGARCKFESSNINRQTSIYAGEFGQYSRKRLCSWVFLFSGLGQRSIRVELTLLSLEIAEICALSSIIVEVMTE